MNGVNSAPIRALITEVTRNTLPTSPPPVSCTMMSPKIDPTA
jgi:hypothetical protein